MGKTIVISNQKGGIGKTLTSVSLSVGLAREGQRVLMVDADPQHSLTDSLGVAAPDKLPVTLASIMASIIAETDYSHTDGVIRHEEGIDLLPTGSALSKMELALVSVLGRELILRHYIETVKSNYDYIVIDTSPYLGLLTMNALTAADCVIVPVAPKYLEAKGLELLLKSIAQLRRQINPNLAIGGILLTMVDKRTKFNRDIISLIENAYGANIHIFENHVPYSIRAAETSALGKSIFTHDPKGKVASAYASLAREVLNLA